MYRLDRRALELEEEFFQRLPKIRKMEIAVHGIDPLANPDAYFDAELSEPLHDRIAALAQSNRGVITGPMMQAWIQEELDEFALVAKEAAVINLLSHGSSSSKLGAHGARIADVAGSGRHSFSSSCASSASSGILPSSGPSYLWPRYF